VTFADAVIAAAAISCSSVLVEDLSPSPEGVSRARPTLKITSYIYRSPGT